MTDEQIIKHLNSISDLLAAISAGTDKNSIVLSYNKDMIERNRYSLRINRDSWRGAVGWGATPADALDSLRKQEIEDARKDIITAQVEQYRAELEKRLSCSPKP